MKKLVGILFCFFSLFVVFGLNTYAAMYGDVDNDGIITASDAASVLYKVLNNSYSMPIEKDSDNYMSIADVSGDGILASEDSAMILQKALDGSYTMPCENNNTERPTETTTENSVRIRISVGNQSALVKLDNNDAARDFASMLPLTLDFQDFNGTEKIAYLPRNLDTSSTNGGIEPSAGDFTLYEPWGNLAIFYNSFHYSEDLIKLGVIESGLDVLTKQNGSFTAKIDFADNQQPHTTKILTVYFSATGNTETVAQKIAQASKSDVFEIEARQPYTAADLNYNNSSCRANVEQNDPTARPEIANKVENMADYDVVFLGYPIWWGDCPKIIYTFMESYDFSDKTVIPFCTSGSTGISGSENTLKSIADANWIKGRRFNSSVSDNEVQQWIDGLNLN